MSAEVIKQEYPELIATRVPPGYNWELTIDQGVVVEGLVPTLTAYLEIQCQSLWFQKARMETINVLS